MAQASGYLLLALNGLSHMPFLMGVDEARFRQFVTPGQKLAIEAIFDQEGSGYAGDEGEDPRRGQAGGQRLPALRAHTAFPADMANLMRTRSRGSGLVPKSRRDSRLPLKFLPRGGTARTLSISWLSATSSSPASESSRASARESSRMSQPSTAARLAWTGRPSLPTLCHPAGRPVELDRQIPKKADQRQMEPWQRYGTYAAGAALEDAGVKGDAAILSKMHLIVACGGGERDYAVDGQSILTACATPRSPASI